MSELRNLLLAEPRRTIAVAESISCGRLQALIGSESGSSQYFLGGVTAYSLDEKVHTLGVNRADADAVNSISSKVAEQMARGAAIYFKSDVAASTTGYAEANPKEGVPEPYAWWGLAVRVRGTLESRSGRVPLSGLSRTQAQERAAVAALEALADWLRELSAARTP